MLRKRALLAFGVLLVSTMLLAACGPRVGSAVPERRSGRGGYLDEIVFSVVDTGSAVTQIQAGAIDIYGDSMAADALPTVQEAGINYTRQNGLIYELTFNPVGPTFPATGKLNPFSSAKVREAMNWLVDRDYMNQEIYYGASLPKYVFLVTQFPDYADLADVVRQMESKYAYNPDKADEVISAEMISMGATKGDDGKWMFDDEAVTLTFIIRTDSDGTRKPLGDYVANQLETIGFTVDRQYKTSSEASPIWLSSDPADGLWHLYTGAWGASIIDRDQGNDVQYFYDPSSAYGFSPLWQAYEPPAELHDLAIQLAYNRFTSLEERRAAMIRALELTQEFAVRVFLIDGKDLTPFDNNVAVSYDLAAGVQSSQIWPHTLRFTDQEGGTLRWGESDLFVNPWNPVAGSNWAFDAAAQRATFSGGVLFDPHTGLVYPLRIERAEVTAEEGLPIGRTLDWLSLDFAARIDVPADAWSDWDATSQTFITAGQRFPEGTTAKLKTVVYYPRDLFRTVRWHDGSNLSVGDFVMFMIMAFDNSKPESAIYDESFVPYVEGFMSTFKGVRIADTSPLTIEYYTDAYQLDAEVNIGIPVLATAWPNYGFGEAGWHQIAMGNLAEAAGESVYSTNKADALEVDWMSFVGGPSLEILKRYLDQAAAESYIPYAPTLGQYVTASEAQQRYSGLLAWYERQGHFWLGTGPYYLDQVFLTEKTLTLSNNGWYSDPSDRWASFGEPKIADVEISGPSQLTAGQEAVFDIAVSYLGGPYPQAEIKKVTVLLYDVEGEITSVSQAEAIADGQYRFTLSAADTTGLTAGSMKLEVAVVPLPVSIPTFESVQFVVSAP